MQHRHAPAVQYPVGRSRVEGLLIAVVALAGGAAVGAWAVQSGLSPLDAWWRWEARPWWALAVLLGLALAAARAWWRTPQGLLAWDGAAWRWSATTEGAVHGVQLAADLQAALLLRPLDARGRTLGWVWAERSREPALWKPLRRALLAGGGAA